MHWTKADVLLLLLLMLLLLLCHPMSHVVISCSASILADKLLHGYVMSLPSIMGIVLICLGFIGLQLATHRDEMHAEHKDGIWTGMTQTV